MKRLLQFISSSHGLSTSLGVLITCQSLLAGGVGLRLMFYYPVADVDELLRGGHVFHRAHALHGCRKPLIYLTTTAGSQKGCEAVVIYGVMAKADSGPLTGAGRGWAKIKLLQTELPQYLTNRPDQFGIMRQMLHVRNGTYYLGLTNGVYKFQNKIDLFDFQRGDWDVFYSRTSARRMRPRRQLAGLERLARHGCRWWRRSATTPI